MSEKKPLVSFVMNCYNGEKYLHRSLDSILKQTYSNWELVFWDNASTDRSKEILESYNEPRFKYYCSKENVSLGQARAWAVDVCQGEFVAFLDVDDEWMSRKTEIQVREMLKDDYVMSCGGVLEVDEENPSRRRESFIPRKSGYLFEQELFNFDLNLPTAFLSLKAVREKGLNFDPFVKASEEVCLFMQLIYGEKVCIVNDILATYYIRRNSLTNKCIDRWYIERFYILDKIKETHPEAPVKYEAAWREANSRGVYYEARYYVSVGDKRKARTLLKGIRHNGIRYYGLYLLLFFPVSVWNKVHVIKNMR